MTVLEENEKTLSLEDWAERGLYDPRTQRLTPQSPQDVAALLHWAEGCAWPLAFSPADARHLAEPLWLDLAGLNKTRRYPAEDFIIQVETGMTFGELSSKLKRKKQAFPLSYPADVTIGDILAEDRPALETGLRGYPRDYVLKTEIATPDGQLTLSGADVVKNVTGYDLAKLYVGARHAFGVMTSATLKLMALPPEKRHWLVAAETLEEAVASSRQLLGRHLPLSICEIWRGERLWQVIAEVSGDELLLDEADAMLRRLPGIKPQPLTEKEARKMLAHLQALPPEAGLAELVLPLGQWPALLEALLAEIDTTGWHIQIRPAAGLIFLRAEQVESWGPVQRLVHLHEGFLQITQPGSVPMEEAAAFNLPADETTRRLLKSLKTGYDPKGVLFSPLMPL